MTLNLTGTWAGNDGGLYFIRHIDEGELGGTLWWAGLHNSGFHRGLLFTNVFQGRVDLERLTIEGEWADGPRGSTHSQGVLNLDIIGGPLGRPVMLPGLIELRQRADSSTGGFGGTSWSLLRPEAILAPQDINNLASRVRRIDSSLLENNPPYRDFSIIWGSIQAGAEGRLNRQLDYCRFVRNETDDDDGDITFSVIPDWSAFQRDFWTSGWIRSPDHIRELFARNPVFHSEVLMFGRENNENDCAALPKILLPGWMESGGDSVLVNGLPINGVALRAWIENSSGVRLYSTVSLSSEEVTLLRKSTVRITGVIASDPGHELPWENHPPEVHPVYAIDVCQNFSEPRHASADLTGTWHANDDGTYYMRQIRDTNTLWWLGLSRDQGRTFANVFLGRLIGNNITGYWADIPVGLGGARSYGLLTLAGDEPLQNATILTVVGEAGGFGGTMWRKLYDQP